MLVAGLSCFSIGLVNTGVFSRADATPARAGRSGALAVGRAATEFHGARGEESELGAISLAAGVNVSLGAGEGGPVRNVPLDFSVIFAAAASPGESDPAFLLADTNFDGELDGLDVDEFFETIEGAIEQARRTGFGGYSPRYDLNDDGRLDERDLELYLDAFGYGMRGPRFRGAHLVKC